MKQDYEFCHLRMKHVILVIIIVIVSVSCEQKKDKLAEDKPGEERMLVILDSITKKYGDDNPYSPQSQLAYFNKEIERADTNVYRKAGMQYYKGGVLLQLGREKEAIETFSNIASVPRLRGTEVYRQMLPDYALAYMRYGERINCINHHMAESCIFPLQGMGLHHDETGSQKAIELYKEVLAKNPDDLASRWVLNIAYMTLGEYPAKVPKAFLIPGLGKDTSGITIQPFIDVASDFNFDTENDAGGAIVEDFNNDGYLDIITSDLRLRNGFMHFFKNDANGHFTDITAASGLKKFTGGLNMIQADYNNDGYTDVLVLRGGWLAGDYGKQPNSLLRNNGDGTFTDVTIKSGLLSFHSTQTAVWRDFNNDGWLDLFIGNETTDQRDPQPCELYMNNGDGTFINLAKEAGCDLPAYVKGVSSADYNNDGWQDLFISTYNGMRLLLKNEGIQNGTVHFANATQQAGLDDIYVKTFPTWFWDYDNDGWPDIFVCGYDCDNYPIAYTTAAEALGKPVPYASKMYLYHNNHDGTFTNVSVEAGLDKSVFAMGSNFGDVDNDGYLDMYLGTGNPDYKSLVPNKLLKNIEGKKFVDITTAAKVGNLQKGHGVAFADLDNDGDQDIFEEVGGAYAGDVYYNSFYLNPGQNKNKWISLLLEGVKSNHSAIGARIKLTFKENGIERSIYRDVNSGGSFGCSPLRREIGIGEANMIDEIAITWPATNKVQVFKNIKPGQFLKIREGSNAIQAIQLKTFDFNKQHNNNNHNMMQASTMHHAHEK